MRAGTFLWSSLAFLLMWMTSCWRNILLAWVSSLQGPHRAWPAAHSVGREGSQAGRQATTLQAGKIMELFRKKF